MGNENFDLEKFTKKNDFKLWRVKTRALLVQQRIQSTFLGKDKLLEDLTEKEKTKRLEKSHSDIILSLRDKLVRKVSKQKTVATL